LGQVRFLQREGDRCACLRPSPPSRPQRSRRHLAHRDRGATGHRSLVALDDWTTNRIPGSDIRIESVS
jgi:hypothetical protein